MNELLDKLKQAETQALEAVDALKELKHSGKAIEAALRLLHDTVNQIRRAQQIFEEGVGAPDVDRFGYSHGVDPHWHGVSGKVEQHESYGIISITKPQGHIRLVGAMVDALPSCIEMRFYRGKRHIDDRTHTEHWFPNNRKPLLTIRMSNYQYAEAISSLNGVGVACTLENILGVNMDDPPKEAKTPLEQIADDSLRIALKTEEGAGADFLKALENLITDVSALGLSQKKAEWIKKSIRAIAAGFHHNVKEHAAWASQRLAEDSEKYVSQAKVEIAAALAGIVQAAGLQALYDKFGLTPADLIPQLEKGDDPK